MGSWRIAPLWLACTLATTGALAQEAREMRIAVFPADAQVQVVGGETAEREGAYEVKGLKPGDMVIVAATKKGYLAAKVVLQADRPRLHQVVILEREAKNEPLTLKTTGKVFLNAKPWANVLIDGKDQGLTPVRVELKAGRHQVVFRKKQEAIKKTVFVKAGEVTALTVEYNPLQVELTTGLDAEATEAAAGPRAQTTGKLVLIAKPWAKVAVDGKEVGTTPLELALDASKHKIEFTKGSELIRKLVTVVAGETTTLEVEF
jgi:hypothetical protein